MLETILPCLNPDRKMETLLMSKRNQVLRKWMKELHNPHNEDEFRQACLELSQLAHQRRKSIGENIAAIGQD